MTRANAPDVRIRRADVSDVPTLVRHRVGMFRDMGQTRDATEPALAEASAEFFRAAVASGEYIAWLAVPADAPDKVVARAGIWLRPMLPRPGATGVVQGHEALIANVYTEPAWRRHGLAAMLMGCALAYTRERGIARVLLHASAEGRPLYESLGFVPTAEMKLEQPE
jgi:GNAT superfamily N-acetyltransferase